MSSQAGSSGEESSSAESDDNVIVFPMDFPLNPDVYDQVQFGDYEPPSPPQANPNDPRRREFDSLYPLDWLVADPAAGAVGAVYSPAPIGRLRTQWQRTFQQNNNGEWDYVEYVPAWSDPDWNTRYTYTKNAAADETDEIARQYAKPGFLQNQRPALRPEDAALNPTDAAKRWGIYPWQEWQGLEGQFNFKGWSGITPRVIDFPTVALDQPRFSPDTGLIVDAVTVKDLASERQRLEEWRAKRGLGTTDEDFRQGLRDIALNPASGPMKTDKAASLLALLEAVERIEERAEYQRLQFAGSTSNELVEQKAWTLGADAFTDLATPLHDLVLRNRWARTEELGKAEDAPRVVYNIAGKQGEYTAHNEVLWIALQPALQLVSQILNSQHPATYVWADIRKLRPIEDERGDNIGRNKWKFSVSPDYGVDMAALTGLAAQWLEFVEICGSGFDTTAYVCEILKRTLEWNIDAQYRVDKSDGTETQCLGSTAIVRTDDASFGPPFKIRVSVAADMIWPLLVDEYSSAEKAAITLQLAGTMLHELSHALVVARCQMLMPGARLPTGDQGEPLWLQVNPSWRQQIADFSAQSNVDILDELQTFGGRMRSNEARFEDEQLFWPEDEVYWNTEPGAEEGWATENQYFGGILESLPSANKGSFPNFEYFRFLTDTMFIAAIRGWETDPGFNRRFDLHGALAMKEYHKLFSEKWWKSDFVTYGPSAMKINNMATSIRGVLQLTILHVKTVWDLAGQRYGNSARDWLRKVWRRMKDETENQFLWRYLFYETILATEAEACEQVWYEMQEHWDHADIAVWGDRTAARDRAIDLNTALNAVCDRETDTVIDLNAGPPVAQFRRLFAALWHVQSVLSREATYQQNVAARFITLENRAAKDRLFALYAGRIRTRVADLYMRVVNEIVELLDGLNNIATAEPNITSWLTSSADITRMWNRDAAELRTRLRINFQHFSVVWDVFSADAAQRISAIDQLGAIPSGAAQTLAGRIKRIAMRQYNGLAPTDPRRKCADEWNEILRNGDLLRNPAAGSPAAQFNQRLDNRIVGIDAGIAAHQLAVANSHPDPQAPRQIEDSPALLNRQPPTVAGSSDRGRVFNAEQQNAFAMASGYRPYRDPTTGFTRFADVRLQQPDLSQMQGALMAPPQQLAPDPGAYLNSLDRRIENTAAQLQQMAMPQGQLVNMATPQPTIFGAAAAQQGQAVQQIEGLVGQKAATQDFIEAGTSQGLDGQGAARWASYTPPQQQQFLDEQAWWRHNFGI